MIQKQLSREGKKLYVAFVDFKKAFDSVQHSILFNAIFEQGVDGKLFDALKSMYSSLTSCVRYGQECSEFFECPAGVRQGCVLSPTLFTMFINQLADHTNDCGVHGIQIMPLFELFILLFADDVALLSDTPGGLQKQLNILKTCCDNMCLQIYKDKTKIMVFRSGGYLSKVERWFFEGKEIEIVNRYCYLGFTFSTRLSVPIGIQGLISKAKTAAFLICRAFFKCDSMTKKVFFQIFDAKVQSILLYSSEVWGLYNISTLETVHTQSCKRFLGVPSRTPNNMIYGDLQRHPLYINSSLRCIKYWIRLLNMDQNRLPKQAYMSLLSLDSNGKNCWVTQVRELLCKNGFQYVWNNQCVHDVRGFLASLKQRLIDTFLQDWHASVRDSDRFALYRSFTDDFFSYDTISDIDVFCFRKSLSQLRFGVLPINSNRYRYSKNEADKMCPFCLNVTEDEIHFIQHCPVYSGLRKNTNLDICDIPLSNLLNRQYLQLTSVMAKFTFLALKHRHRLLEA